MPVYAAADGYVSRMKQSSFGYGNVLYITHAERHHHGVRPPERVQGARLRRSCCRRQYDKQSYELELLLREGPVSGDQRGSWWRCRGNTGGSAGPHLHWEVRDAQDRQYNPLQWGGFLEIQDHVAPTLQALAVEPLGIEARVKNGCLPRRVLVPKVQPAAGSGHGVARYHPLLSAAVGLLVQGFDRFDNAWNKNGIQRVADDGERAAVLPARHRRECRSRLGARQVSNFVDFLYQYSQGRTLQKAVGGRGQRPAGCTPPPAPAKGGLNVEAGKLYTVDLVPWPTPTTTRRRCAWCCAGSSPPTSKPAPACREESPRCASR
jgi:hypothetical protein